jgi:hypothetical protein
VQQAPPQEPVETDDAIDREIAARLKEERNAPLEGDEPDDIDNEIAAAVHVYTPSPLEKAAIGASEGLAALAEAPDVAFKALSHVIPIEVLQQQIPNILAGASKMAAYGKELRAAAEQASPPALRGGGIHQLPYMLGQFAPLAGAGLAGGAAGAVAGEGAAALLPETLGLAGRLGAREAFLGTAEALGSRAGTILAGGAQVAVPMYHDILAATGGDEDKAMLGMALGFGVGATQVFGVAPILSKLERASHGSLTRFATALATETLTQGAQQTFQQAMLDAASTALTPREMTYLDRLESAGHAGALGLLFGGTVGAIVHGTSELAGAGRAKGAQKPKGGGGEEGPIGGADFLGPRGPRKPLEGGGEFLGRGPIGEERATGAGGEPGAQGVPAPVPGQPAPEAPKTYAHGEHPAAEFNVPPKSKLAPVVETPIADLERKQAERFRSGIDEERVMALAEKMHAGEELPPVIAERSPSGKLTVLDGHHRIEAADRLGFDHVPVRIVEAESNPPETPEPSPPALLRGAAEKVEQELRDITEQHDLEGAVSLHHDALDNKDFETARRTEEALQASLVDLENPPDEGNWGAYNKETRGFLRDMRKARIKTERQTATDAPLPAAAEAKSPETPEGSTIEAPKARASDVADVLRGLVDEHKKSGTAAEAQDELAIPELLQRAERVIDERAARNLKPTELDEALADLAYATRQPPAEIGSQQERQATDDLQAAMQRAQGALDAFDAGQEPFAGEERRAENKPLGEGKPPRALTPTEEASDRILRGETLTPDELQQAPGAIKLAAERAQRGERPRQEVKIATPEELQAQREKAATEQAGKGKKTPGVPPGPPEVERQAPEQSEPFHPKALQSALAVTGEQSVALDALAQAMGLDRSRIRVIKGGKPGSGALHQQGPQWYFSNLLGSLEKWQPRGTAEQFLAHIKKTKGAEEEANWIGLEDWARRKGKLTRDEIAEFVGRRQVHLIEVQRGGSRIEARRFNGPEDISFIVSGDAERIPVFDGNGQEVLNSETNDWRYRYESRSNGHQYQVVGSDWSGSWRAWDATNGQLVGTADTLGSAVNLLRQFEFNRTVVEDSSRNRTYLRPKYESYMKPGGRDYTELLLVLKDGPDFDQGHWDTRDVVAHVLAKTRTDPQGRKLFHIEEVQSDWHRRGREEGYDEDYEEGGQRGNQDEIDEANERLQDAHDARHDAEEALDNLRNNGPEDDNGDSYEDKANALAQEYYETFWQWRTLARKMGQGTTLGVPWENLTENEAKSFRDELAHTHAEYLVPRAYDRNGERPMDTDERIAWVRKGIEVADAVKALKDHEAAIEEAQDELHSREGDLEEAQSYRDNLEEVEDQPSTSVPDAPFKGASWSRLTLKRALAYAAEHGFDGISWSTGRIVAERYNLSRVVDRLTWGPSLTEGRRVIKIHTTTGESHQVFIDGHGTVKTADGALRSLVGQDISSVVPKELAERIKNERDGVTTEADLAIGGQWAKNLYDRQLVAQATELGKPLGAKPEKGEVDEHVGRAHVMPLSPEAREKIKAEGFPLFQGEKGSVEFTDAGHALIRALNAPDVSTGAHELAHVARRWLLDRSVPETSRAGISNADIDVAEKWAGAENGWTKDAEEKFARGFERFLRDGKAPTPELRSLFQKFRDWLSKIYTRIRGSAVDLKISREMRAVYGKLVTRGAIEGEEATPNRPGQPPIARLPALPVSVRGTAPPVEKSTPAVAAEEPPRAATETGGFIEPLPGPPPQPTGIKNKTVERELRDMGLPEPQHGESVTRLEHFDRAKAALDRDASAGEKLVNDLEATERPPDADEGALLALEVTRLANERDAAEDALNRGEGSQAEVDAARSAYARAGDVVTRAGTTNAQALDIRQMMVNRDYSLAEMERSLQADKGEPLTPSELETVRKEYDELSTKNKLFERRLAESEQGRAEAEAEAAMLRLKAEVSSRPRQAKRQARITQLSTEIDDIVSQLAAKAKRPGAFAGGLDPETLKLTAQLAAKSIERGARQFAAWADEMVGRIGEHIRPYLREAWDMARKERATELAGHIKEKLEAGAELPALGKQIREIARHAVENGVNDREALVTAVQETLNDAGIPFTRRQTLDAIAGYGNFRPLSKGEVDVKLRDYQGQLRQVAKIEDLLAKIPPKKSGVEHPTPSDTERGLIKQVENLKRKLGIKTTSPETQLRTALDATKTRLRNQIADLSEQITSGKRTIDERAPPPTDAEVADLRARRDVLRAQYEEIFPAEARPRTPEERIAAATRAVEKSLADLETRLAAGDTSKAEAKPGPTTPALEAMRARRDALRAELSAWQEAAVPAKTPEEIAAKKERMALKAYKTRKANEIARLKERMVTEDFGPRPKKPPLPLDAEATKAKADAETVRRRFETRKRMFALANRTKTQKVLAGVKEVIDLPKAVMTAWDLSAVLRQGGFFSLGHPVVTATEHIPRMLRAAFSERGALEADVMIRNRPLAQYGEASGLQLTKHGDDIGPHEEAIRSAISDMIPGIKASNRAFITFLNLQRSYIFDTMVQGLPVPPTVAEGKAIANAVNIGTGRGNPGKFAGAVSALAIPLWSPRLLLSRFQLILAQPLYGGTAQTRVAVAKQYGRFLIGLAGFYALTKMYGAMMETEKDRMKRLTRSAEGYTDISHDLTSPDLGKARFGNTRVDPLAGLSQVTVLMSRIGLDALQAVGLAAKGKKDAKTAATLGRFMRTKLSPTIGIPINFLEGNTPTGEPFTKETIAQDLKELPTHPWRLAMAFSDLEKALRDRGVPEGAALGILGIFGASLQTYEDKKKKATVTLPAPRQFKPLLK